jgi:diguanylate cyclase (GGDEF)-like protein/PAS domain S-box-containing protein
MADDEIVRDHLRDAFIARVAEYAIVVLDQVGRVLSWNVGAERIQGYRAEEIMGRSFEVFYSAEDVERGVAGRHLADAAALGHLKYEGWRVRADGSRFWAEVVITAIHGPQGAPRGFGEIVRDSTESRRFQKELMRRALHDPLTGLANRALLLDRIWKALARLERHQETVAVFFIDLDGFKAVNDTFGHQAGDRVLVAVAERLRCVLRSQDTVARLSGDEFVVLCEGLHASLTAGDIGDRLAVALSAPMVLGDRHAVLGASIGGTVTACAGDEPEALLQQADTAMYQAKRAVGGEAVRLRFFEGTRADSASSAPQPGRPGQ